MLKKLYQRGKSFDKKSAKISSNLSPKEIQEYKSTTIISNPHKENVALVKVNQFLTTFVKLKLKLGNLRKNRSTLHKAKAITAHAQVIQKREESSDNLNRVNKNEYGDQSSEKSPTIEEGKYTEKMIKHVGPVRSQLAVEDIQNLEDCKKISKESFRIYPIEDFHSSPSHVHNLSSLDNFKRDPTDYISLAVAIMIFITLNRPWELIFGFGFACIGALVYNSKLVKIMSEELPFKSLSLVLLPLPLKHFLPFVFNSLVTFGFSIIASILVVSAYVILRNNLENWMKIKVKISGTPIYASLSL